MDEQIFVRTRKGKGHPVCVLWGVVVAGNSMSKGQGAATGTARLPSSTIPKRDGFL